MYKPMKKTLKTQLFLVFTAVLLTGCVKEPYFEKLNSFELLGNNDTSIAFVVNFDVFNPNKIDVQVDSFYYKVYYKDIQIADGFSVENFVLNGNASTSITSDVFILFSNLVPYVEEMSQSDSVNIKIMLEAYISKLKIKIKKDFDVNVKSKELMDNFLSPDFFEETFNIKTVQVEKVTLQQTDIVINMEFTNPLPVEYVVNSIDFKIYADDTKSNQVGVSKQQFNMKIDENATQVLPVEVSLDNLSSAISLFGKMMSKNYSYFIDGYVSVGITGTELVLPLSQTIELPH